MESKISHIFFDLDGTLLNDSKAISNKTYEQLNTLKQKYRLEFGIATGRNKKSVNLLLEKQDKQNIFDYLILDNGVELININKGLSIKNSLIEVEHIKSILKHYSEFAGVTVAFHNEDYFCSNKLTQKVTDIMSLNNIQHHLLVDEFKNFEPTARVMLLLDKSISLPNHLYSHSQLTLIQSEPLIFEYMDKNISKFTGLRYLAELNKFNLCNVMFFGDSSNDFEMIQKLKHSVAMSNATESIKSIAKYITDYDNQQDGVMKFLNQYKNMLFEMR